MLLCYFVLVLCLTSNLLYVCNYYVNYAHFELTYSRNFKLTHLMNFESTHLMNFKLTHLTLNWIDVIPECAFKNSSCYDTLSFAYRWASWVMSIKSLLSFRNILLTQHTSVEFLDLISWMDWLLSLWKSNFFHLVFI